MDTQMKLIVDEREKDVYIYIQSLEVPEYIHVEKQVLPLGDFLVTQDDDAPVLLYERKAFADLFASIKDGRYEEQSFRLLNDERFPNKKDIVYVVEGMYSQLRQKSDKKLLFSTMTSLLFFKGFSVLRTSSAQDTGDLLIQMIDKIHRDFAKGKKRYDAQVGSEKCYSSVVKTVKKDNITKENIGVIMLSQIPGISSTTATAVMKSVDNSMSTLINTLNTDPKRIEELKIGEKPRKISKSCVESMKKYLCDEPSEITSTDEEILK